LLSPRREDAKGRRGDMNVKGSGRPAERRVLIFVGASRAREGFGGDRPIACRAGSYEGLGVGGCHETTKRRNDQSGQHYGQGEKAVALAKALRRDGRAWEMDVKEDLARMRCEVGIGRCLRGLRAVQFGA